MQTRRKAGTVVPPKELEARGLDKLLDPQVIYSATEDRVLHPMSAFGDLRTLMALLMGSA